MNGANTYDRKWFKPARIRAASKGIIVALALISGSPFAFATIIDFSDHRGNPDLPYIEDGFRFTLDRGSAHVSTTNDLLEVDCTGTGSEVTGADIQSRSFTLKSLEYDTVLTDPASFNVTSSKGGVRTVSMSGSGIVNFDSDPMWQNISSFKIFHPPGILSCNPPVNIDSIQLEPFGRDILAFDFHGRTEMSILPDIDEDRVFLGTAALELALPDTDDDPNLGIYDDPWRTHWTVNDDIVAWLDEYKLVVIPFPDFPNLNWPLPIPPPEPDPPCPACGRLVVQAPFDGIGDDGAIASIPQGSVFRTVLDFEPFAITDDSLLQFSEGQFIVGDGTFAGGFFQLFNPDGQLLLRGFIDGFTATSMPLVLIDGDTNADGQVNVDDLNNVRNNFGANGLPDGTLAGDAYPFDGLVNIDDLNLVRNNVGQDGEPVPEPGASTMILTWIIVGFVLPIRRRAAFRRPGLGNPGFFSKRFADR